MAAARLHQLLWEASQPVVRPLPASSPLAALPRHALAHRLAVKARLCSRATAVAGSLNLHAHEWLRLAQRSGVVRLWLSRGAQIAFLSPIRKFTALPNPSLSPEIREQVALELRKLLGAGALETCSRDEVVLVSPIFLVPKKNGKWRLVHDLRFLNGRMPPPPRFKLESVRDLKGLAHRGDVAATLDMSSGYHQLMVAQWLRPFLGVQWNGQYYRFKVLPFGLAWAPFIFHKVMRQFVKLVRAQGVRILSYLDDFLVLAASADDLRAARRVVEETAARLGVIFSEEKCCWEPRRRVEWLGTAIDLENMAVSVPETKKVSTRKQLGDLLRVAAARPVNRRWLASVVGAVAWARFAAPAVQLYLRSAYALLRVSGRKAWSGRVWLPTAVLADLRVALQRVLQAPPRPLVDWAEEVHLDVMAGPPGDPCEQHVWSDSSDFRWGAVLLARGRRSVARDVFARSRQSLHINEKELLAALFALRSFACELRGRRVRLHIDNTTALWYLHNFGGRSPALTAAARLVWEFAWANNIELVLQWVPSESNLADAPSRSSAPAAKNEWMLSPKIFRYLVRQWGSPAVDRFASASNAQVPRFNSWGPDPEAEARNAFAQDWAGVLNYANPPWPLISRVLSLAEQQRARVILIVPWWPSALWWPRLQAIATDRRHFAPARDLFAPSRTGYRPLRAPAWGVGAFLLEP